MSIRKKINKRKRSL